MNEQPRLRGHQPKTISIFLSHSGRDAKRATLLAAELKASLESISDEYRAEVFNTSEPEHRFKEIREYLNTGEAWQPALEKYDEDLRTYLSQRLFDSSVYVLLVTRTSLAASSPWVAFEIETARSRATSEQRRFFLPIVQGGARLWDLPEGASEFQGLELTEEDGVAWAEGITELAQLVFTIVKERERSG